MKIKLGLILLVATCVAGCGAKTASSPGPTSVNPLQFAANEWRVPSQAIVVTDASGTMYQHKTFPFAKTLTQAFVKSMPEGNTRAKVPGNYDASSIGFGGDERIVSALAPFNRSALAGKADSLRLLGDINGMGGTTPLHDVFAEIHDALASKSGVAAIVIFSDGMPQDESASMEAARWVVGAYAGDVCIHTVHLGGDSEGARHLAELAALTKCGSTRELADVWSADNLMSFTHDVFAGAASGTPDPCAGRIVLRGVEFAFDKAELTGSGSVILDFAVEQLKNCPSVPMDIDGHTDSIGSEEYNQSLGQRRANTVKNYFVSHGVRADRINARSYGESRPVASNDTDEGRQTNRRVELHPR
jgi:outer membrane protein OmpA-like peptidoglycan-associated protein